MSEWRRRLPEPQWSGKDLWPALVALVTLGLIAPEDVRRVAGWLVQAASVHRVLLAETAGVDMVLCVVLTWNYWPEFVAGFPRHGRVVRWVIRKTWTACFLVSVVLVLIGLAWLVQTLLPDLGWPWPYAVFAGAFMFLVVAVDQKGPTLRLPRGAARAVWYFILCLWPVGTYLVVAWRIPGL